MMTSSIDEMDLKIMQKLQQNGRITAAQLSKELNLSAPSIRERIIRLEESGVITGYSAIFNWAKLDRSMTTFIMVKTERCQEIVDFCEQALEVTDLHRISGEYNYMIKVQTSSMQELANFQERLVQFGPSKSQVSMKNIIEDRHNLL
ncbi:Lrp/AsnC family transcriptional regulator [Paenibacillus wulumuqiensis]|uniref:Lrp/AsnC family transcriptional regulator n=1 Tax=Paenibacillus wulumuqiensis TaxID=1567107 RepID=UPI001F3391BB|nr:Lrp/AsnC family transcriptional regulator [Paenibacillus wulumuqiensis]